MGATGIGTASVLRSLRGACVAVRLSLSLVLAVAAGALAWIAVLPASALAAPTPIALDAPDNGTSPLISYDPVTQTTYVAWTAEPSNTGIDLCILPADSTTCEGGAPIDLVDSEYTGDLIPTLGDLYVLPGGIVVVLGVAGNEGSVEWKSPAGGGAFAAAGQGLQSGGLPISTIENYYQADDAVPLGSNDLGVLDGEHNMFADVPLAGGTSPTPVAADSQEDFSHAPLGTGDAPQIGAEATPGSPGEETVVTVGDNENPGDQTVPAGCGNVYATGYGVSGRQNRRHLSQCRHAQQRVSGLPAAGLLGRRAGRGQRWRGWHRGGRARGQRHRRVRLGLPAGLPPV